VEVLKSLDASAGLLDFVEISGGTYENSEFVKPKYKSSAERESFFLGFCVTARKHIARLPIMCTGGFRSAAGMRHTLSTASAVDIIGVARPLAVDPDFAKNIINEKYAECVTCPPPIPLVLRPFAHAVSAILQNVWHQAQIKRIANGVASDPNLGVWGPLLYPMIRTYYWDPQKNPIVAQIICGAMIGGLCYFAQKKMF